MPDQKR